MITLLENRTEGILIRGIDGESFARVTNYADTLWWKPLDEPMQKDKAGDDVRLEPGDRDLLRRVYDDGLSLTEIDPDTGVRESALVLGIEVGGWNVRTDWGGYYPRVQFITGSDGSSEMQNLFMPAGRADRAGRAARLAGPADGGGDLPAAGRQRVRERPLRR